MKFTNIAVRIAGVSMFAIPASLFAFEITQRALSWQGTLLSPAVWFSFSFVLLFAIPGFVIAAKGPLYGDVARDNRRTAIKTMFGLGLVIFAFILTLLIFQETFDIFFFPPDMSRWDELSFRLYAYPGICAGFWTLFISAGLASLLSGRNLFRMYTDNTRNETEKDTDELNSADFVDPTEN